MTKQEEEMKSIGSSKVVPLRPASQEGESLSSSSKSKESKPSPSKAKSSEKKSGAAKKKTTKKTNTKSSVKGKVKKKAVVVKAKKSATTKKSSALSEVKKTASQITQSINENIKAESGVVEVATKPEFSQFSRSIVKPVFMEEIMSKSNKQFDAYAQEATEMSREALDAAIKSSTIFAKGVEEIVRTSMTMAQSAAEKQASFAKEAMTSKTINEWADLQNKYTQGSFDEFMSGATKLSEMAVKILSDASEPVNEQMTKAMNSVQKAA